MAYIAHVRKADGEEQLVKDHLLEVQELAEEFGAKIGLKHLAGLAGVLHDVGKYSTEFQEYLRFAVANPTDFSKRGSVDHSTAGGRLLAHSLSNHPENDFTRMMLVEIVSNVIISHHGGLNDYLTLDLETPYFRRIHEKELVDFEKTQNCFFSEVLSEKLFSDYCEQAYQELSVFIQKNRREGRSMEKQIKDLNMLSKYLFSCLIDADRTNTRLFEEKSQRKKQESLSFFDASLERLNQKLEKFSKSETSKQPINVLRKNMSEQAVTFAEQPSGIYQLSIPTGGGKTLASLRYGLRHAQCHEKERIIYVVPFTTIIEQNAEVIREIVGDKYVLEHHSNVIDADFLYTEFDQKFDEDDWDLKLAKDNWDAPIILTTMVQYLNVFYSRGTRNVRRLHNLAKATVIFDEVQAVPIKCLALFNESVNFLKSYGHTSLLLCTATQPALAYLENGLEISGQHEIIQDLPEVVTAFKRVKIVDKTKAVGWNKEEIVSFSQKVLEKATSLLIILNTKKAVREVFQLLTTEQFEGMHLFHLSTGMCPKHRKDQLEKMKHLMEQQQPVICVSSQLIEAGVDISFDHVIRSVAGLDAIAQAAGRCNRHGLDPVREVYVINVDSGLENTEKLTEISRGAAITGKMMASLKLSNVQDATQADLLQPAFMERYFQEYYTNLKSSVDYPVDKEGINLFELLGVNPTLRKEYSNKKAKSYPMGLSSSITTIGKYFNVIDSPTTSVLVPYDEEAKRIIAALNGQPDLEELTDLLKRGQQYSVNLYKHQLDTMDKNGLLFPLYQGKGYYLLESAYDQEYGVDTEGNSSLGLLSM